MEIVIAVIIILVVLGIVLSVSTKKKGGSDKGKKQKNRAQIMKEAGQKLAKDPHNADALSALGDLYFSEHNWEKAYPIYETMSNSADTNRDINPFEAKLRRGICALKLDKPDDAIESLEAACDMRSTDFDANYYLGQALYARDDYERAISCFKKALAIKPEATVINTPLGFALYKAKHFRDSIQHLRRTLDENPDNKEALFCMADAMQECGYADKAIKVFLHLRPDPEFGPRSCLSAGNYHAKLEKLDQAVQDYQIGLKHQNIPQDIRLEILYRLANVYFMMNAISNGMGVLHEIQQTNQSYKDVPQLIDKYGELNQNKNLQIYLMATTSDFVALCRKIASSYYKNSFAKITDVSVTPQSVEILMDVETPKWQDSEVFRFYRSTSSTGEFVAREFHGRVMDSKANRGVLFVGGTFSEDARKFAENRPIDLVDKVSLTKLLKQIDADS